MYNTCYVLIINKGDIERDIFRGSDSLKENLVLQSSMEPPVAEDDFRSLSILPHDSH